MKYLFIICALVIIILVISVFFLEEYVVSKLPDENKFKKWWRSRVIGIYDGDDY
jgi:membrane carboxypeptidase/penicillin-binding protein